MLDAKPIHLHTEGRGRALVLLHGWGFDSQVWSTIVPLLQTQFTLYRVDLPGFGQTPPMLWNHFKSALLQRLPQQFAVLGWSLGGFYATKLALEAPSRVTHLINVASSPKFLKDKDWPGVDATVLSAFHQQLLDDPIKTRQQFIELQLQGHAIAAPLYEQMPAVEGLTAGLELLKSLDLRAEIHQLSMPVCYMFGGLDAITPKQTYRMMQAQYAQFQFILFERAAHAPFLSHPDEFIHALRTHL